MELVAFLEDDTSKAISIFKEIIVLDPEHRPALRSLEQKFL